MMASLAKQASPFPFEDVLTQTETSDKNKKIITVHQYYVNEYEEYSGLAPVNIKEQIQINKENLKSF